MISENEYKIGSNYRISMNKKLGSGAFGEIYHGKHQILKFYFFVLKIISP